MTTLITGGAGFIGANLANRLIGLGERVRILDDLSRPGVEKNAAWLESEHRGNFELVLGDVRDAATVDRALRDVEHVFHLAAQVAVTTSLVSPRLDFEVNALGTLTVLEGIRRRPNPPSLLFTSTNKVYGALDDIELRVRAGRYEPIEPTIARAGISEARPLCFHSPYGCSKGCADQYVLDYARTFDLRAVVFRMSCIYGPRQFGNEDQGWVAHFLIRALRGEAITIFGDGKQVRDVLFVEDLVDAMLRVQASIGSLAGRAFNVGGGPTNTLGLLDLVERIEGLMGRRPRLAFEPWRVADQRYYVSDVRELGRATGWSPRIDVSEGLGRLFDWLKEQRLDRPADAHGSARVSEVRP